MLEQVGYETFRIDTARNGEFALEGTRTTTPKGRRWSREGWRIVHVPSGYVLDTGAVAELTDVMAALDGRRSVLGTAAAYRRAKQVLNRVKERTVVKPEFEFEDLDTGIAQGLARWRTGDVVKLPGGNLVLVGHMNEKGGCCECCGNDKGEVVGNLFDAFYDARSELRG